MKKIILSLSLAFLMLLAIIPFTAPHVFAAETKTLELVNQIDSANNINTVVASHNGEMLLIQESYSWNVYLYNMNSGIKKELLNTLSVGLGTNSMCFSLDGSMCAISTNQLSDGSLNRDIIGIYSTKSGELLNEIELGALRGYIAFDRYNNLIAYDTVSGVFGYGSKQGITIRNTLTGDVLVGVESDPVKMFCQNPSSDSFASATWGNTVKIHDGNTGGSVRTIEIGNSVENMAYSPNGKYLAISDTKKTILLDAGNNYSKIREINDHGRISFSKGSDMVVIGNAVYFADDNFNDYTTLTDNGNSINGDRAFMTQDGKYYLNYDNNSKGIRMLDATKVSLRLKEIRVEPEVIELAAGGESELKLIGLYSDGSTQILNLRDAKLTISDFSVAKINDSARIQGLTVGEAELGITYLGREIKKPITVVPRKPIDTASEWAQEGINSAIEKGIVPDDIQDNYKNIITRQEFCRMAVLFVECMTDKTIDEVLAEKGVSRNPNAFTDTSDPNILAAFALGITNGTAPGTFTPNGQFSREQAATMIRNTCKVIGLDVDDPAGSGFTDMNIVSSWAIDGVNFCNNNGIMNGTGDNKFSPKGTYTRQESIVTFDRIK